MKQISLVIELQNLDMRIDEHANVRASLQTKLQDASAVNVARVDLESSDERANELKAKLRSLELETSGLTDKLKQVNERLYSGRITNAKELAGLNQDEKMLERRKSELEDVELGLMEQIEASENALKSKRAEYEKVLAQSNAQADHARAALRDLDAADADLSRKRDALRGQLSAETLRVYDELRRTKKGRAVAQIKSSSCSACGNQVPSGLISRAALGDELVFCVNCGRILAS
ncbi:MAG TPA: C4-type zinc ribbon domain-containing protein [Anaerolineae bacterium]|nr:C4-type zinc ribbon domain-containing protein [Anaerolineae bacterium]